MFELHSHSIHTHLPLPIFHQFFNGFRIHQLNLNRPLTRFPILCYPTKFTFNNSSCCSFSFQRHRCSPDFLSGIYPISRNRRSLMGHQDIKVAALGSQDGEDEVNVLEQEVLLDGSVKVGSLEFEATLNRFSKWLIAVLFGVVLLLRHDAEAVWATLGSILNSALSVALKRILNQERPIANLRLDPGMPSSHAQAIFFIVMFLILSIVEWMGVNEITAIFAAVSLAFGSYLSWLRVTQKLHTIDQVAVGAVLGSCFSIAWLWSWNAVVSEAFNSYVWAQVSIVLASAVCCLAFLVYVIQNWFDKDR